MQDLDSAIVLDPLFAQAYVRRAVVHTLLSEDSDAQKDIDRAVELGIDRGPLESEIREMIERQ